MKGPNKGELVWASLGHSRALQVLHNPRYTGAFVSGRSRQRMTWPGHCASRPQPKTEWLIVPNMHPGYLSWEDYEQNERRLREAAQALGGAAPQPRGKDRHCCKAWWYAAVAAAA